MKEQCFFFVREVKRGRGVADLSRDKTESLNRVLAPIESAYATSYWSSTVTLVLSCPVSEIVGEL